MGLGRDLIVRARSQFGLRRQPRRLSQSAGAHRVELFEPSLCALKLFSGLARVAGGAQQSNQHGLGALIGGREEAQRPRVA